MVESNSGVFAQVEEAVAASRTAFQTFLSLTLRQRGDLLTDLRLKLIKHTDELALMEEQETGMGIAKDKALQIKRAILGTPGTDYSKRTTECDEEGLILDESFPYGVSVALHPLNHPTASIINCSIMLLAAGNTVVHLLPKRAEKVARYTVRLINSYLYESCGIPNLSICMRDNRYEYNKAFMEHPDAGLIVVTGGDDVVRCALSLKKRVIAAGAVNPLVIVDSDFDPMEAAKMIMEDITFDHNLLCTSEKCAVVLTEALPDFAVALMAEGAFFLNAAQADALLAAVFDEDLVIRKEFVGKSAPFLLKAAGIEANADCRAIVFETEVVSPFVVQEFAAPVLPLVRADSFREAIDLAAFIEGGRFHTAAVFSRDIQHLSEASRALRTSLFLKNSPTLYGAGIKGNAAVTFTIANVTGEGPVVPAHLVRHRKCVLLNCFEGK